ncbi:DDE superfamily endonuclease [Orenia metallireducens]|uniref:DDE superfamily endonuclease n=1 Tax=Orenia metallireducens TaxID=1413210 RepID=A0A285IKD4_9FIRM|nr:transposase [Orenia metallireducens]PRX13406.1 DDE superfamily endonuclease [Orenia metallireducens]SNY48435.1 DDE superfamily endonuclease [Orenia metallireducens]
MINIPNNSTNQTLKQYLLKYRSIFTKPSFEIFNWLILAIISIEEIRSIKFLYDNFISKYSSKVLNSFYYFLSHSSFSTEKLMRKTVDIVLNLISSSKDEITIFLSIDDTLQAKYGNKFDCYYKLFDHTSRTGSSYLNGHCFVSLVINIPLKHNEGIKYLSLPVGYKLYDKSKSKLKLASELINIAMPLLKSYQVILLCDSWYTKGSVLDTVNSYDNLDLIGAVRKDTAIFDLPPKHNGKRGRPRLRGDKLDIHAFSYEKANKYFISTRRVMTRLFKTPVYITVTAKDTDKFSSTRLFICTINPGEISIFKNHNIEKNKYDNTDFKQVPLSAYSIRWNIEVIFYQHKFFWSFGNYMVRNKKAIERYVNLLAISYTFVSVLPFIDQKFEKYKFRSPQKIKRVLAENISKELIFDSFVSSLESSKIYSKVQKAISSFLRDDKIA